MTNMFKPTIKEEKPLPAPARITEKPLRFETPDDQLNRDKRKLIGRDRFKIDLASPGVGTAEGTGLQVSGSGTAAPGSRQYSSYAISSASGRQLPR